MSAPPASAPITAPVESAEALAERITLAELYDDPFPAMKRFREELPVPYIPAAGRYFVTRYADVHQVDNDAETFTADESKSLMKRSMGHSMLRKDDPEHAVQRASYGNVLKPKAIKSTWSAIFAQNFERYLADLKAAGPGAELCEVFAAPFAAENLRRVMGFENATDRDMIRWSQTMINGTGNYADDPDVWAEAARSSAEVDIALDEMVAHYRQNPNESLISGIVHGAHADVTIEDTRANLKMSIGGGINEPRDALTTTLYALFTNPEQEKAILEKPALWRDAFEESVRWIAPIGMYPRQTTRDVELGGTLVPAGSKLGVVAISANRDESVFTDAARFDIFREKKPHLGFGGGVHFCAGAWIARSQVAQIGLPGLYERLPGLALDPSQEAVQEGWVFRGMTELPVTWS